MNFTKTIYTGVDIPINGFQKYFYPALKLLWSFQDTDFDLYGRARRNPRDNGYVPEVHNSMGNYTELLFNDQKKVGQGFFVVGDEKYKVGTITSDVSMILMLNAQNLPHVSGNVRGSEFINLDVAKLCNQPRGQWIMKALVKRIENIFTEYPQWKDTIKYRDMFPYHCLRIDFEMMYNIYQC